MRPQKDSICHSLQVGKSQLIRNLCAVYLRSFWQTSKGPAIWLGLVLVSYLLKEEQRDLSFIKALIRSHQNLRRLYFCSSLLLPFCSMLQRSFLTRRYQTNQKSETLGQFPLLSSSSLKAGWYWKPRGHLTQLFFDILWQKVVWDFREYRNFYLFDSFNLVWPHFEVQQLLWIDRCWLDQANPEFT